MNIQKISNAIKAAKDFISRAEDAEAFAARYVDEYMKTDKDLGITRKKTDYKKVTIISPSKEIASMKRSSMDLTRVLADLRKP